MANPEQTYEAYRLCRTMFEQKKYEEINSLCENMEAAGDYNADTAAVHSAALLKMHKRQEAKTFLLWMLGYFPNDARLHYNLSRALMSVHIPWFFLASDSWNEYLVARELNPSLFKEEGYVIQRNIRGIFTVLANILNVVVFIGIIFGILNTITNPGVLWVILLLLLILAFAIITLSADLIPIYFPIVFY